MNLLLSIKNLKISVPDESGFRDLVKGINLDLETEKILALVGGSGSGKTTTALAILRLLALNMQIEEGQIIFQGQDLLKKSDEQMRRIRGKDISMVFQEPLSTFNPVFCIGDQIAEVLKFHTNLKRKEINERVLELLDTVGIPDPKRVVKAYPHQLSGGLRQRAMIAQAIAGNPKLLIADEPTSNLDVVLQARIIQLFKKLKSELKLSILLITHDLGVVRALADQVAILYDGRVVEFDSVQTVLNNPRHAFTGELTKVFKD